jgi:hypothetical protein
MEITYATLDRAKRDEVELASALKELEHYTCSGVPKE